MKINKTNVGLGLLFILIVILFVCSGDSSDYIVVYEISQENKAAADSMVVKLWRDSKNNRHPRVSEEIMNMVKVVYGEAKRIRIRDED